MAISHDAIKTIQNGVFVFFFEKERKPVSLNNKKRCFFSKRTKKIRWVVFWKNTGFSQP